MIISSCWRRVLMFVRKVWFGNTSQNEAQTPIERWYDNGQKEFERYYINGKFHRLNGPSSTSWYYNGQKHFEYYHINGKIQSYKYWNKQGKAIRLE